MIRKIILILIMGVTLVGAASSISHPVILVMGCLILFAFSIAMCSERYEQQDAHHLHFDICTNCIFLLESSIILQVFLKLHGENAGQTSLVNSAKAQKSLPRAMKIC